ncbi:MAG: aldolase/citrate lyase family protein, partial [Anaerolineae bacterium]
AFRDAVDRVNDELVIVLQAEHTDAVQNIASIVQVPGIDAVLVGPFDLSGSLGVLGELSHPSVLEAIEVVRHHCQAAGLPLGIFAPNVAMARRYIGQGFRLIALGMDVFFLWQAAQAALSEVRAGLSRGGS